MIQAVVGFLFSKDFKKIVLIEKKRPEWQKGFLNGVGGKIESNETPYQAMCREFTEEADRHIFDWHLFHELDVKSSLTGQLIYKVHFFWACSHPLNTLNSCKTKNQENLIITEETEYIDVYNVKDLHKLNVISNLHWLIPMVKDSSHLSSNSISKERNIT
jgi:8-oxo-dGTP diphosphatase